MLPREDPDRIHVAFDDHRLVANAGLLLPASLALRLGLCELVDQHVDRGHAPGRANPGDKLLTLVASALAGGDSSTTPMPCALGGPTGCWVAWSRRRPLWEPSCASSGGVTCASWTG